MPALPQDIFSHNHECMDTYYICASIILYLCVHMRNGLYHGTMKGKERIGKYKRRESINSHTSVDG